MSEKVTFREIDVYFMDQGVGIPIVLLHGYLESSEIWRHFAVLLADRFRVISIDLPGHGKSGIWGKEHHMDDLAGSVVAVLDAGKIDRAFVVGHSMGGYVTMALADRYPERLLGYALFHSTCYADSDEKKVSRDREISLVLCKKTRQIVKVNIPKAFADENVEPLRESVRIARNIALQNPDPGIVALLNGMKSRPDRTHVISNARLPLLLIGGMKDNYIPAEVFESLVRLAPHATVVRLEESGHMGFMEEPEKSADAIRTFVEKNRPAYG
jgi:pimeloyl-ACP methyl ester carboxylesterase